MAMVRMRYRSAQGSRRREERFAPMTFADEFPDIGAGLPKDWIATDYSFEWEPDGTLVIIETNFTLKELRSIDTGIAPEVVRMVESEDTLRYPPDLAPAVYDETAACWVFFRGN